MTISAIKPTHNPEEFPVGKDDRLFLALEDIKSNETSAILKPWKILVVDDEKEVHIVTRLALEDFRFAGRGLEFINVYTGAEAKKAIHDNPDTALILLDVVMESDDAGLEVARYVRQELGNHFVRIILRTGQPGMAPERRVLKVYDINDYRAKTELTQDRMFSAIYTALSSYRDLIALARSRHRLAGLVNELEQFAHIAAADLQVPLTDLIGQVQLFQRNYQDKLEPAAKEYLDSMWHTTLSLQGVVNDLLTVAKVGGQHEIRTLTDSETVLDEVCEAMHPIISARQAVITHDSLPKVYANHQQLVQLFQNLISNAIKFQPGKQPQVHIAVLSRGRDWLFSVNDKGIGITFENLDNVFRLFNRINDDKYEGSGIGLAICEKIVRWHGGKIWAESTPENGTSFFFTLPLRD